MESYMKCISEVYKIEIEIDRDRPGDVVHTTTRVQASKNEQKRLYTR